MLINTLSINSYNRQRDIQALMAGIYHDHGHRNLIMIICQQLMHAMHITTMLAVIDVIAATENRVLAISVAAAVVLLIELPSATSIHALTTRQCHSYAELLCLWQIDEKCIVQTLIARTENLILPQIRVYISYKKNSPLQGVKTINMSNIKY